MYLRWYGYYMSTVPINMIRKYLCRSYRLGKVMVSRYEEGNEGDEEGSERSEWNEGEGDSFDEVKHDFPTNTNQLSAQPHYLCRGWSEKACGSHGSMYCLDGSH